MSKCGPHSRRYADRLGFFLLLEISKRGEGRLCPQHFHSLQSIGTPSFGLGKAAGRLGLVANCPNSGGKTRPAEMFNFFRGKKRNSITGGFSSRLSGTGEPRNHSGPLHTFSDDDVDEADDDGGTLRATAERRFDTHSRERERVWVRQLGSFVLVDWSQTVKHAQWRLPSYTSAILPEKNQSIPVLW